MFHVIERYFFISDVEERQISRKRPIGPGSEIVTKHDAIVCGRKNAKNVANVSIMMMKIYSDDNTSSEL